MDLSGIFPPITTPFNEEEQIDYDKLRENLERWNEIPFKGYVVQGSNGEFAYLDPDERIELVKKVKEYAAKEKLIIAGAACEGTNQTIAMVKCMALAGVDSVLVSTPCFYKSGMTKEALQLHYTKVADSSPVPVILYSVPTNTGIDLNEEIIVKLSEHPNIIGLKDSGGNITKIGSVLHRTMKRPFQVLAGSASFLYASLTLGAVGGVCALANVLGREVCHLVDLHKNREHEKAKTLQHQLIAPNTAVTAGHGIAGLKAAMDMFGYYGGSPRSPLLPITNEQIKDIKATFSPFL
ncbi:4-hydroxy-2-oxoglutarate aldolase, mitochondrial-like [Xenia sp. Carnegie-2017]|uniref:4-hydroxy-2-oxoglutarate aldolase, mitochondrial-like n=1 Tax=Xenia sp. Carnegie-2017 TaxID=2897299 RepID=UPI001F04E7AB|nr:4-hydroxy-2-oxoglutarate aldolase, mitochondrial-like [Xenia sp. Carnegie-2017]